jgi:UDP-N-acetylmuramyl pentapeptide phosphotransferase/UDP-N-acetylglucosamine-1-phosphate transferase
VTEGTILAIVGMACLSVVATAAVLRDVVLALLERKRAREQLREVHIHHHQETAGSGTPGW